MSKVLFTIFFFPYILIDKMPINIWKYLVCVVSIYLSIGLISDLLFMISGLNIFVCFLLSILILIIHNNEYNNRKLKMLKNCRLSKNEKRLLKKEYNHSESFFENIDDF